MQLRPELTFAYANSRTGHTDSILRKIARPGVFPADRPLVGTGISGAIFLDRYDPDPLQWSMLFTRLEPKASIFVLDYYGNHSPLFNMDRTIAAARALGFDCGWRPSGNAGDYVGCSPLDLGAGPISTPTPAVTPGGSWSARGIGRGRPLAGLLADGALAGLGGQVRRLDGARVGGVRVIAPVPKRPPVSKIYVDMVVLVARLYP